MKRILYSLIVLTFSILKAGGTMIDGIYYLLDSSTKTAAVIYTGTTSNNYNPQSTAYKGNISIPASVTYNEITYTVTTIRPHAFYNCTGLLSITIPNSVTTIMESAFAGCTSITSVNIPNVKYIDDKAFYGCTSLDSINMPKSLIIIGEKAFYGCTGLESVNIPESVDIIRNQAFYACGLNSVTLNNNQLTRGGLTERESLLNIFSTKEFIFGPNVTSIGKYALAGYGMPSITIPSNIKEISEYAFYNCPNLQKVIIQDIDSWASIRFGDNTANPLYQAGHLFLQTGEEILDLERLNGVSEIGDYAFSGWRISTLNIPSCITKIGVGAFSVCSELTTISFNEGLREISDYAFRYCNLSGYISFPQSLAIIGEEAFFFRAVDYQPVPIKGFILQDNIEFIGPYALAYVKDTRKKYTLFANRGSKTLIALWNAGYSVRERGTNNQLPPPSIQTAITQTSVTFTINNVYEEYKYLIDNQPWNHENILVDGLLPETKYEPGIELKVAYDDSLYYKTSVTDYTTEAISPELSVIKTATSLLIKGQYNRGDAEVDKEQLQRLNFYAYSKWPSSYDTHIKYFEETENRYWLYDDNAIAEIDGNTLKMTGLYPNWTYSAFRYRIWVGDIEYSSNLGKAAIFSTDPLTFTTLPPKVISEGNVIIGADSNIDDDETNVGFEWRRTDWTDDFPSNTCNAGLYEGRMEGYIRNLNPNYLWKYRPYYMSDSGTYYYGDWMGLDPTNTSYFEPTVHTYASIVIEGNTALVKGYALRGSDNVTVQGFQYWQSSAGVKAASNISIPGNATTVEASGQVMTAKLTGLEFNTAYTYVAFVKTSEGETFYGEPQTFTIGDAETVIEEVVNEENPKTMLSCYDIAGHKLERPVKGINLLHMSDGSVQKVLVR